MKKLVKESLNEYPNPMHESYYDEEEDMHIDSPNYWEAVAEAMRGELTNFNVDYDNETRDIQITLDNGNIYNIKHNWREDGSETKPWTYVNGDDKYGRLSIWEDDPAAYADDILRY